MPEDFSIFLSFQFKVFNSRIKEEPKTKLNLKAESGSNTPTNESRDKIYAAEKNQKKKKKKINYKNTENKCYEKSEYQPKKTVR